MSLICFVMANEMVARAMPASRTSGVCRTVPRRSTSSPRRSSRPNTCRGFPRVLLAPGSYRAGCGFRPGRVMLKATWSEEKQTWLLNGVKRFITNGDGDVSLVLARTEEGTTDARGLSMLVYDKRDGA